MRPTPLYSSLLVAVLLLSGLAMQAQGGIGLDFNFELRAAKFIDDRMEIPTAADTTALDARFPPNWFVTKAMDTGQHYIKDPVNGWRPWPAAGDGITEQQLSDSLVIMRNYVLARIAEINTEDADADPANEIQVLSINGTVITLNNGGGSIDVAGLFANYATFASIDSLGTDLRAYVDAAIGNISVSGGSFQDTITQTGHGFSVGDILTYRGGAYELAKADADYLPDGIVTGIVNANSFAFNSRAWVYTQDTYTAGEYYYLQRDGTLATTADDSLTVLVFRVSSEDPTLIDYTTPLTFIPRDQLGGGGSDPGLIDSIARHRDSIDQFSIKINALSAGGSDGNNYPTSIAFSGTTTKTLTLQRNGLGNLTATFTDNVNDADASATNEIQTLSVDSLSSPDNYIIALTSGGSITLPKGGGAATFTGDYIEDLVIQQLGDGVRIQGFNPNGTNAKSDVKNGYLIQFTRISDNTFQANVDSVALAAVIAASAPEGALVAANNLSDLTDVPTARDNLGVPSDAELATAISNSEAADLDKDPTNEIQTAGQVTSTDGNVQTDIDALQAEDVAQDGRLDAIEGQPADNDRDPTNELQTATKSGLTVTISDGGGSFSVADNDNDPTNELYDDSQLQSDVGALQVQAHDPYDDTALTGRVDSASTAVQGNSIDIADLQARELNTDDQQLSYNPATQVLTLENGSTVDLSGLLDNTDSQVLSVDTTGSIIKITISGGNEITFPKYYTEGGGGGGADGVTVSASYNPATQDIDFVVSGGANYSVDVSGMLAPYASDQSVADTAAAIRADFPVAGAQNFAGNNFYPLSNGTDLISGKITSVSGLTTVADGLRVVGPNVGFGEIIRLESPTTSDSYLKLYSAAGNTSIFLPYFRGHNNTAYAALGFMGTSTLDTEASAPAFDFLARKGNADESGAGVFASRSLFRLRNNTEQKLRILPNGNIIQGIATTTNYNFDMGEKSGAMRLPQGTTAQRPTGTTGLLRFNTELDNYEGYYADGGWDGLQRKLFDVNPAFNGASTTYDVALRGNNSFGNFGETTNGFYAQSVFYRPVYFFTNVGTTYGSRNFIIGPSIDPNGFGFGSVIGNFIVGNSSTMTEFEQGNGNFVFGNDIAPIYRSGSANILVGERIFTLTKGDSIPGGEDSNIAMGYDVARQVAHAEENMLFGWELGPRMAGSDTTMFHTIAMGRRTLYQTTEADYQIVIGDSSAVNNPYKNLTIVGRKLTPTQANHAMFGSQGTARFTTGLLNFKTDVAPTDGQTLVYNAAQSAFIPAASSGSGGGTAGVSAVTVSESPVPGQGSIFQVNVTDDGLTQTYDIDNRDGDFSSTNELQTITENGVGIATLSNGGGSFRTGRVFDILESTDITGVSSQTLSYATSELAADIILQPTLVLISGAMTNGETVYWDKTADFGANTSKVVAVNLVPGNTYRIVTTIYIR